MGNRKNKINIPLPLSCPVAYAISAMILLTSSTEVV